MHTILIPYDFSLSAHNAADYAVSLFKNRSTRFIFVHVISDQKDISIVTEQLRSDIQGISSHLDLPHHEFLDKIVIGDIQERISAAANVYNADAIFMGTKGKGDSNSRLMGSNTSRLLEVSTVPVMVIPRRARYTSYRRMVLATDYRPVQYFDSYDYLMRLLQLSNAEFIVLNVENEDEPPTMERTMAGISMEKAFSNRPHRYEFVRHSSRVQGILEFLKNNDVDLLAMIKRDHYLLEEAIEDSIVGRTVMEIDIPLLSLAVSGSK
jgi:nucleotide-binding universal stress UspA family protein